MEPPATERRSYRILDRLGSGGFGTVWRGQLVAGEGFVKSVAIKILSAEAELIDEFVQRLRDEARILALLRHRAIVQVDDLVRLDGRWAVVMEYIDGADLSELMKQGPIPAMAACGIGVEIASALNAAHTASNPETGKPMHIVHRDIKPANIRITTAGEVKVLDFGVARGVFDEREAQTRSLAFGSMGYLAPERFDGIDTSAVDIYALGVVLYECLSGKGMGQLSVRPKLHTQAVEEAVTALEVSPEIKALLITMIDYEPEDRPTADEVARTLRNTQRTVKGEWLADWAPRTLVEVIAARPEPEPPPNSEATLDSFITARQEADVQIKSAAILAQPEVLAQNHTMDIMSPHAVDIISDSGVMHDPPAADEPIAEDTSATLAEPTPPAEPEALAPIVEPAVVEPAVVEPAVVEPAAAESSGGTGKWIVLVAVALLSLGGAFVFLGPGDAEVTNPTTIPAEVEPTPEPVKEIKVVEPTPEPAEEEEAAEEEEETEEEEEAAVPEPAAPVKAAAPVYRAPASISIEGDHDAAWLVSFAGTTVSPGQVPPGAYTLHAVFGEDEITGPTIEVSPGRSVAVACNSVAQICRIK